MTLIATVTLKDDRFRLEDQLATVRRAYADEGLLVTLHRLARGVYEVRARFQCSICNGDLIGAELAFGTCGDCGGRAIHP